MVEKLEICYQYQLMLYSIRNMKRYQAHDRMCHFRRTWPSELGRTRWQI